MIYLNYMGSALILLGIFLMITAVVGVIRFPDFFTRLHPAGIADSLGSGFILIGLAMKYDFSIFTIKLIVLMFFMWITGTTSCQALAHAAYHDKKKEKNDVD